MIIAVLERWHLELRETESSFVFIISAMLLGTYKAYDDDDGSKWRFFDFIFRMAAAAILDFITVQKLQNLVGIDAIFSIMRKF